MKVLTDTQLAAVGVMFETSALLGSPVTYGNLSERLQMPSLGLGLSVNSLDDFSVFIGLSFAPNPPPPPNQVITLSQFMAAYNSVPKD